MGRRWAINLVLLALVAALSVVAYLKPGKAPIEAERIGSIARDEVSRIRITRGAAPEIVLERHGGGWRLAAPFTARANGFKVDSLLSLTTATSDIRLPASDLARYGLDPPGVAVWLNDASFAFGDRHPIEYRRYLLHGDAIHLVADSVFRHLVGSAAEFADTQVLGDIVPTGFELPGLRLTLGQNGWAPDPPRPDVTADRVNALVDEWRHVRALDVQHRDRAGGGETLRVQYQDEQGKQWLELRLLARQPDLILYRPDERLAYRLPGEMAKRLLQLPPADDAGTAGG